MPHTVLVVPTGHGVGLTATCLGLLRALDARGVDVGFFKPVTQPRADERSAENSVALVRLTTALRPPEPVSADVVEQRLGEGALEQLMEEVVTAGEEVLQRHEVVIVEGLVPRTELTWSGRINLALAKALDAEVLLVGADESGRGHAEVAERVAERMAIAESTYRSGETGRVVGAVVNRLPDDDPARVAALREALGRRSIPLVGAVAQCEELTWPRALDLVRALDLQVLSQGDSARRVKEVVVAAQAVPGMLPLLAEGRLIVVPGDRHEVVLATCLAAMNGVRLGALLLTIGVEPDERVWALCRPAAATGLPIYLSQGYTYEVASRIHDLDSQVPADDAERAQLVATVMAEGLDETWLDTLRTGGQARRLSPAAFRRRLTVLAREAGKRIVLPEGAEPRTLQAAAICQARGIATCVLLANQEEVEATAAGLGLVLPDGIEVVDPGAISDRHVEVLVEARKHKGVNAQLARDQLAEPITLGTVMLAAGEVDGLVAGAVHTTAATLRPALQVLRTAPGAKLVSSVFFMCLPDEVVIYGDCAVNPDPDAGELADIAIQSAASARAFGIEPRVAMISFSTGTSGAGSDVQKVAEATRIAREREPDLLIDGPLQYDAATTASVARSKAPDSPVAGRATVFVFPDLNTGNTTYKAVQRNAGVVSIGPMLQGLAKPVNDLSRGALVEDVVYTIALTAIQAARG